MRLDPRLLSNRMPDVKGQVQSLDEAGREQARRGLVELISDAASPLLARISAGNALGLLG
ncbi:MAG: hypothetical protein JRG82_18450, partial [Deltaproteobacteria bacterium]|nr:hypothetical protein [Deltaproteobacteria bacterium]